MGKLSDLWVKTHDKLVAKYMVDRPYVSYEEACYATTKLVNIKLNQDHPELFKED